ncbi:hypothetical protein DTO166G4_7784 [Paecilomyces variotii]|nr:hypothetical protein DTO166G4_7784 [Paecilomyces variotii]KAJ9229548.1 hypothetical protein DTO169E5_8828 [Paecilomyces variotii]KAJ9236192.1 hypothetical protein DTO166G5_4237 [Paecilomyces variotii]KAJ9284756.1 hypothetical protein DTO021C3_7608 [Paecilomyces variotii]KAJ9319303.1 hypothetical protein DTO271D3_72 [Paecilomyces variotii]
MSYNDYNDRSEYGRGGGNGGYGRDEYSDNRRDDGYGNRGGDYDGGRQEYGGGRQEYGGGRQEYGGGDRSEGRYNDTRYDDTPQNRYSSHNDDYSGAVSHAQRHDDDSDQNSSFFSQAASFLSQNKDRFSSNTDIDEEQAVKAHKSLYGGSGDSDQQHSSQSVGAGAAIEALKKFTQGSSGGGDDKSQLIGLAMAQASKLWDQQGGNASGDKQSAINSAAEMALKMYLKNQGGSGLGGTGGPSGLLSLASKFL